MGPGCSFYEFYEWYIFCVYIIISNKINRQCYYIIFIVTVIIIIIIVIIVIDGNHFFLQKTVVAVLNCMVSPDWRHLPKPKDNYSKQLKKDIELAWSSEPSDPISYQFHYKIVDGDDRGRDPAHDEFNWKTKSCLFLIANSGNKVTSKSY